MTAPDELAHLLKAIEHANRRRADAALTVARAAQQGADLRQPLAVFEVAENAVSAAEHAWRAR